MADFFQALKDNKDLFSQFKEAKDKRKLPPLSEEEKRKNHEINHLPLKQQFMYFFKESSGFRLSLAGIFIVIVLTILKFIM